MRRVEATRDELLELVVLCVQRYGFNETARRLETMGCNMELVHELLGAGGVS